LPGNTEGVTGRSQQLLRRRWGIAGWLSDRVFTVGFFGWRARSRVAAVPERRGVPPGCSPGVPLARSEHRRGLSLYGL